MSALKPASNPKLAALPEEPMARLLAVMTKLRDPNGGCPWDLKQDFVSLAKYTLEEAYEVVEAAEKQDFKALKEELGDLLLQVVFYGQMGKEAGKFSFADIAATLNDKLIRRHPHVFGDEQIATAEAMTVRWESDKAKEREGEQQGPQSALDGIATTLPALSRCQKLVQRATRVGFDWEKPEHVLPKLQEEIAELEAEMPEADHGRMTNELGDVLFTAVCLAHKLKIDPESALRRANQKFERRFKAMEELLAPQISQNTPITLQKWEQTWIEVKNEE